MESKTLYDTWKRFKDLLKRCPYHWLLVWLQVQTFYKGLNQTTRSIIDVAARGTLNTKMCKEAMDLFEEMALNNY